MLTAADKRWITKTIRAEMSRLPTPSVDAVQLGGYEGANTVRDDDYAEQGRKVGFVAK